MHCLNLSVYRNAVMTAALALTQLAQGGIRHYPAAEKIPFGACAGGSYLTEPDGRFAASHKEEFNLIGCENGLKMYIWNGWSGPVDASGHPLINFSESDRVRDFAIANHQMMRGHVLVYDQAVPWFLERGVSNNTYTKTQVRYMTWRYIQAVVSRYKNVIHQWDVTNEFLNENGTLKSESASFWRRNLTVPGSPDWHESIYRWAREADPDCKLYYCDYNTEHNAAKFNGMMNVIQPLRDKGLIDGIAFQCHIGSSIPNVGQTLASHANAVAAAGMEWLVSELDIAESPIQADLYEDIANVCFSVPKCKGMMLWGVNDSHSWRAAQNPLILDQDYNKKPAYYAVSAAFGRIFPKPGTYYKISNRYAADKRICVEEGSLNNGARLLMSNAPVSGSDWWRFVDIGSGYYKIENQHSGRSFDVIGRSTADWAGVQQYSTAPIPGSNQQWRINKVAGAGRVDWISDDYFAIVNKNSDKCAVPDNGGANNAPIQQIGYDGGYSRQWIIAP